ncbi:EcoRII N-terminal effector-binding domain-containing protein [Halobacillus mangrovi]|uniref:Restriction endonuclease type II EcoRII N-terminal domain-containing protein n=1 Tax=Halobacillus mangrovi TaxID=402384 RepID=A0A1W5ZQT9_9BACI|nr:EcoRII N-terminal effector-binding domain-containing protein [Halobacillus mangrovi]ARI75654.1 hypothetical protein HM131_01910 [Halobacillus mangrovi]
MKQDNSQNTSAIKKLLSSNDTGETGTHQAGMLIPKREGILSFFPSLGIETKNPRVKLKFFDPAGESWDFMFIYYNNQFFGGTRNEYRLTGMTRFIKQHNLKAGDSIILNVTNEDNYLINYERHLEQLSENILKLGNTWKVLKI